MGFPTAHNLNETSPEWHSQAGFSTRYGGFGLRDSTRTAPNAYWSNWADAFPELLERMPVLSETIIQSLESLNNNGPNDDHIPSHLRSLYQCFQHLLSVGFLAPSWREIMAGVRPPDPDATDDDVPGEWKHGWQRATSKVLEKVAYDGFMTRLRTTSPNAEARLNSASGPLASAWLLHAPRTPSFILSSPQMRLALRRRAGADLGLEPSQCEGCNVQLDRWGHHRCACMRTGRAHNRHKRMTSYWRQVLMETGAEIPDRNMERLIRDTQVRCDPDDRRRMDLIATDLEIYNGLPLFIDYRL